MPQQELLEKIILALNNSRIQYMITGSLASSLQGEPRSTHDIDIVISIPGTAVKKLADSFSPEDFYLDEADISEAVDRKGMFNLIDIKEGGKVDFWVLTDEPFDKSRFSRRCIEEFMGIKIQVSSPEDTILVKLKWSKLSGGSEKQFIDALRVYEVQLEKLDTGYIEKWVKELGVGSLWQRLKDEAKPIL